MTLDQHSTGLLRNHCKKFDALLYKSIYSVEEFDTDFTDDNCIVVYKQSHTPMMDTGTIPKGELAGFYILKVFWTSNQLGNNDLEVLVYKNGSLDDTLTQFFGGDFLTTGSIYTLFFNPISEYRLVVRTGLDAGAAVVKLDYIQLENVPRNMVGAGETYSDIGDGTPYIQVHDSGVVSITGDGNVTKTGTITYNNTYMATPQVFLQTMDEDFYAAPTIISSVTAVATMRSVTSTPFTDSVSVVWNSVGPVACPFRGGLNII
jgi:hypothetical protein